jgi:hypothetical protein
MKFASIIAALAAVLATPRPALTATTIKESLRNSKRGRP